MTKREFNKAINACRNSAKTRLEPAKLARLPIATRRAIVQYLIGHNGPVLTCLLCARLRKEFEEPFETHGYWRCTGDFIHSEENGVRYPILSHSQIRERESPLANQQTPLGRKPKAA